ncbi:uncharacterized protein EV420DRAFT_1597639 [Desarmillaria tabescens]|uniref:CCR4-NOT transcription complex subunit 11 n=1 Tax=Armillaria tabescens TaxID=1929756 RepID=A0AA39J3P3_ARMTA|nr:uncharacterized protein EV420DRAFT_1597639 [Desarmillaria tabescens]KAK0434259.1 hypothetical protein EV420DRAFT_1597639 [Desarmillaria tabescens]
MSTVLTSLPTMGLPSSVQTNSGDPVRASVGNLLSRAYSLPCSTAAQAFIQLVQPTSRFQLALDVLLPLLDPNTSSELAQRILVSYILYSLYAPHPISINPFKSVLFVTFVYEREKAVAAASRGDVSVNEQLVWVLWKILRGDGNDIGPYSPSTLARSPLPPKLRATNLLLDDDMYNSESEIDDYTPKSQRITTTTTNTTVITAEEDAANEGIAHAMKLLLDARERVLTLSEQRAVTPSIHALTSSQMITPLDLAPIITNNPNLAHPLFVALLSTGPSESNLPSPFLDILSSLPPTLPSFDLMGRLLREPTMSANGSITIADLVRTEALGRFVHECINWLDQAELQEKEGLVSDDRFAKGVQHLCRFYTSLIKLSLVDAALDADTAEMAHFSLRHSRFEEANHLYRVLATGML